MLAAILVNSWMARGNPQTSLAVVNCRTKGTW